MFQPDLSCGYGPSAPDTPREPATPHSGHDFRVQYQLITPIMMGQGVQYSVFAEPPGEHSPGAAGLARQELTQLAQLLGQAALLEASDVPEQVRACGLYEGVKSMKLQQLREQRHLRQQ